MHKSRLAGFVIDCRVDDLGRAAQFWSEALGYRAVSDPEDPKYAALETPEGEIVMMLQQVDHESRVHLDIETDDKEAEAARLEALGARRVAAIKRWIVMEAPTGHRFCVVNPQRSDFQEHARAWGEQPPARTGEES
jgi:predicted enzyme related to lactoylglutathione lyase